MDTELLGSQLSSVLSACRIKDLGVIGYQEAYALQRDLASQVAAGGLPTLLLCEHLCVVTLGRMSHDENILLPKEAILKNNIAIHAIDRGGDVTLHSPGQLVAYPIFNLKNFGKDLKKYLNKLEQVVIDLLNEFDIVGTRLPGHTGVWVGKKKIASLGIGVKKWVAFHGVSVNVSNHLELFSMIRPCGLDVEVTSIEENIQSSVKMDLVKTLILKSFQENFDLKFV